MLLVLKAVQGHIPEILPPEEIRFKISVLCFILDHQVIDVQSIDIDKGEIGLNAGTIIYGNIFEGSGSPWLAATGQIGPVQHSHPNVIQGQILDVLFRHAGEQTVAVSRDDIDIIEHDITDHPQRRLFIPALDVHKDGKAVGTIMIHRIRRHRRFNGNIRKLNILKTPAVFHVKSDSVLGIPYDDIAECTIADGAVRTRTQFNGRVIADEHTIGHHQILAGLVETP